MCLHSRLTRYNSHLLRRWTEEERNAKPMECPWNGATGTMNASYAWVRPTRLESSMVTSLVRHVPPSISPSSVPAGGLPGTTRERLAGLSGLRPSQSLCCSPARKRSWSGVSAKRPGHSCSALCDRCRPCCQWSLARRATLCYSGRHLHPCPRQQRPRRHRHLRRRSCPDRRGRLRGRGMARRRGLLRRRGTSPGQVGVLR